MTTLQKLEAILARTEKLWTRVPTVHGKFTTHPDTNPDFSTVEEFVRKWTPIASDVEDIADGIRTDIVGLRDEVKFSELTIAFNPLQGYGYKYSAATGEINCWRYKDAQKIIDIIGEEIDEIIRDMKEAE